MVFDIRFLIFDLSQNEWDECQLQGMYWGEGKTGRTSRSIQVMQMMIFDLYDPSFCKMNVILITIWNKMQQD